MVAKKEQTTGQPKAPVPEPSSSEPPAGAATGEKSDEPDPQGKQSSEGGTTAKRKTWVRKSPVDHILEQVAKQEKRVADLKAELAKEENALNTMREATRLLGGS